MTSSDKKFEAARKVTGRRERDLTLDLWTRALLERHVDPLAANEEARENTLHLLAATMPRFLAEMKRVALPERPVVQRDVGRDRPAEPPPHLAQESEAILEHISVVMEHAPAGWSARRAVLATTVADAFDALARTEGSPVQLVRQALTVVLRKSPDTRRFLDDLFAFVPWLRRMLEEIPEPQRDERWVRTLFNLAEHMDEAAASLPRGDDARFARRAMSYYDELLAWAANAEIDGTLLARIAAGSFRCLEWGFREAPEDKLQGLERAVALIEAKCDLAAKLVNPPAEIMRKLGLGSSLAKAPDAASHLISLASSAQKFGLTQVDIVYVRACAAVIRIFANDRVYQGLDLFFAATREAIAGPHPTLAILLLAQIDAALSEEKPWTDDAVLLLDYLANCPPEYLDGVRDSLLAPLMARISVEMRFRPLDWRDRLRRLQITNAPPAPDLKAAIAGFQDHLARVAGWRPLPETTEQRLSSVVLHVVRDLTTQNERSHSVREVRALLQELLALPARTDQLVRHVYGPFLGDAGFVQSGVISKGGWRRLTGQARGMGLQADLGLAFRKVFGDKVEAG